MEKLVSISADEIAEAMRDDPDFGMDVLACFAAHLDARKFANEGAACRLHLEAAPVLRELADSIAKELGGTVL